MCELDSLLALTCNRTVRKAIFVGDDLDLPTDEAYKELPRGPLSTSYLARVKRAYRASDSVKELQTQYSTAPEILASLNKVFYMDILAPQR